MSVYNNLSRVSIARGFYSSLKFICSSTRSYVAVSCSSQRRSHTCMGTPTHPQPLLRSVSIDELCSEAGIFSPCCVSYQRIVANDTPRLPYLIVDCAGNFLDCADNFLFPCVNLRHSDCDRATHIHTRHSFSRARKWVLSVYSPLGSSDGNPGFLCILATQ